MNCIERDAARPAAPLSPATAELQSIERELKKNEAMLNPSGGAQGVLQRSAVHLQHETSGTAQMLESSRPRSDSQPDHRRVGEQRAPPHRRARARVVIGIASAAIVWGVAVLIVGSSIFGSGGSDAQSASRQRRPRNIIFMVSDGFGIAGGTLARVFRGQQLVVNQSYGRRDVRMPALRLDEFAVGHAHTYSADSLVTDSAAGATAWACALKTNNHMVAVDPRTMQPCATLMEAAKASGMATGVAVTSSVTDATPAAFATHARHRHLERSIALQYATGRVADVIFGGGSRFFSKEAREALAGVPLATDVHELRALTNAPAMGLFAEKHHPWEIDRPPSVPSLKEMAEKAVHLLARAAGEKGFFLLVEGSKIDKAAHPGDVATHLHEILAYDEAVGAMLDFAAAAGSTLVLSTSDHETGGLALGRGVIVEEAPTNASAAQIAAELPLGADGGEAPLHERSLLAQAQGRVDEAYMYNTSFLHAINASTEAMVDTALQAAGGPSGATLLSSEAAQAALLAGLAEQLRVSGGCADGLAPREAAYLRNVCVGAYAQLGKQGCLKALGVIISSRAHIGWSTWGHTGADVLVHASGPGAEVLAGSRENTDIGRRLEVLMGWDLAALTAELSRPPFDEEELRGELAQDARWD
eukprot:CAMPEP_0119358506 /NCGR_PEP_ID=MMETSP1334-20130426/6700_1 /TAXON_ID=127549 /ORGANISM="Calcidiscus leptoporus, Strain RCC1130" /LENGTH=643 /DNA_ID=CAMNT_0007373021 /DNA_START=120 /DNA_END=2051 /DNA_ORIENTATION=+